MLSKVRVQVNGKINLSLNVTGKRGELHTLDSVLASVSLCDYITVRDRLDDKVNLIFNADFAPENNTVLKAVDALRRTFGSFGVDIVVDKHLPLSGGLGGSSADAAGVIAALNALFDFDKRGLDLDKVCASVGSDVRYMYDGGFARMTGTGEKIDPIPAKCNMGVVFLLSEGVLTGDVYRVYDKLGGDGFVDNDKLIGELKEGRTPTLGNMLFRAASSLRPEIEHNLRAMKEIGLSANMTGSGSAVYALCDDPFSASNLLTSRGLSPIISSLETKGIIIL